ncbi:MAG: hypothetical protein ACE5HQ_02290 [Gemmatimonadota bacterium]
MTEHMRSSVLVAAALALGGGALGAQQTRPPLPIEPGHLARVVDHPDRHQVEVIVGPVSLPAGGPHLRPPVQLVTIPISGWLHGFEWSITDGSGSELPHELLHHVNLIDPDARELFAPIARRVMAAGRETQKQKMPKLLGYPLNPPTRILVSSMFANSTDRDFPEVYLHVRLFYSREGEGLLRPRDVFPFYMDVMGPLGAKDFPLPPGASERSWEGSPAIDGRILAIGGHLHNYATWLRLEDVTAGKLLWDGKPKLDEQGRVTSVPTRKLWWRGGVKIRRDHTYRIVVHYDNPLDRDAPDGGMGALGGIMLATGDSRWPPLNRHDLAYVNDLQNTLEAPRRMMERMKREQGGHAHGEDGSEGSP